MANQNPHVKITGDASGIAKAVGIAQGAMGTLQTQMTAVETLSAKTFSVSGIAGIGLSATAAAAALVAAVKSAADYGDELDNLSKRTGESVENLSRLQYAAKMSDVTNESLGKGLKFLAGQIVGAASGAETSAALFEKYGVSIRNTDGTVRATGETLLDLADVFAAMPDGPQKAALAMEFFGSKIGVDLIPLLNEGSAGLKKLGDEAERYGLVISGEQAKAAADFNDNLDRLSLRAKAAGIALGNVVIPAINNFIGKLEDANKAQLSLWQTVSTLPNLTPWAMLGEAINPTNNSIKKAIDDLEKLKAKREELAKENLFPQYGKTLSQSLVDSDIADLEKRIEYLKAQNKRIEGEDQDLATKRKKLALNLATELASLEQLRAIAAGKASADILKDDKARTADQIKEAEKLRDALRSAWDTSRSEAAKAADEATKLLAKAAGVRTSALDKATSMREAGLSPEEKAAAARSRAEDAQGQGSYYAAAAAAAKLDGRAADFEKYQKQAEAFLERAQKFAEESGDPNLVEGVGNQQASLLEQQAKAKQAEAAALQERAAAQAATLKDLDAQLTALQTKATAIEVKVKIDEAVGKVGEIQKALDAIKDKTVTVTVNQVSSVASPGTSAAYNEQTGLYEQVGAGASGSWATGGWTGTGGKYDPAGVVHRREFVINSERTAEPGTLDFLWRLHHLGLNGALKGYAGGGLVDNLQIPSITAPSAPSVRTGGNTVNLSLDGRTYAMQAGDDVVKQLSDHVARQALKRGGRR